MNSEFTTYLPSPIGDLTLRFQSQALKYLSLSIDEEILLKEQSAGFNNKTFETISLQLRNYFSSASIFENIALVLEGTLFQKSVWQELSKIPVGETRTYGEIARKLNSSPRAVGNACRKNPIQIIVPCHRVLSAQGIGGYAGETEGRQVSIKRWLLKHEGVNVE